jgi:hypothetical protein
LFGTRKTKRQGGSTGYDDVEQLLMQVGVLGAFLLSISLPMEVATLPGTMNDADFFAVVASSQKFREYVVKVMPSTYDWVVPTGVSSELDVRQELLVNIQARHQWDMTRT